MVLLGRKYDGSQVTVYKPSDEHRVVNGLLLRKHTVRSIPHPDITPVGRLAERYKGRGRVMAWIDRASAWHRVVHGRSAGVARG